MRSSARTSGKVTLWGERFWVRASSVNNLNQNVISSYYKSVYTPENLVITAAGNLKHEALVNLAAQEFESLPPVGVAPKSASPQTNASINLRSKKELEQVHLIMGVPCYPVAHEKRFACYLLNTLLGGGMSSRLFQNIRERQGLAYSVYSDLSNYRDTGCLSVYAGTSLESARKVVDSVLKEFQRSETESCGGRRTAPGKGPPERFAHAQSGIHLQPYVKSGPPGNVLPSVFHSERTDRPD